MYKKLLLFKNSQQHVSIALSITLCIAIVNSDSQWFYRLFGSTNKFHLQAEKQEKIQNIFEHCKLLKNPTENHVYVPPVTAEDAEGLTELVDPNQSNRQGALHSAIRDFLVVTRRNHSLAFICLHYGAAGSEDSASGRDGHALVHAPGIGFRRRSRSSRSWSTAAGQPGRDARLPERQAGLGARHIPVPGS